MPNISPYQIKAALDVYESNKSFTQKVFSIVLSSDPETIQRLKSFYTTLPDKAAKSLTDDEMYIFCGILLSHRYDADKNSDVLVKLLIQIIGEAFYTHLTVAAMHRSYTKPIFRLFTVLSEVDQCQLHKALSASFSKVIESLSKLGIIDFNATIPIKEELFDWLISLSNSDLELLNNLLLRLNQCSFTARLLPLLGGFTYIPDAGRYTIELAKDGEEPALAGCLDPKSINLSLVELWRGKTTDDSYEKLFSRLLVKCIEKDDLVIKALENVITIYMLREIMQSRRKHPEDIIEPLVRLINNRIIDQDRFLMILQHPSPVRLIEIINSLVLLPFKYVYRSGLDQMHLNMRRLKIENLFKKYFEAFLFLARFVDNVDLGYALLLREPNVLPLLQEYGDIFQRAFHFTKPNPIMIPVLFAVLRNLQSKKLLTPECLNRLGFYNIPLNHPDTVKQTLEFCRNSEVLMLLFDKYQLDEGIWDLVRNCDPRTLERESKLGFNSASLLNRIQDRLEIIKNLRMLAQAKRSGNLSALPRDVLIIIAGYTGNGKFHTQEELIKIAKAHLPEHAPSLVPPGVLPSASSAAAAAAATITTPTTSTAMTPTTATSSVATEKDESKNTFLWSSFNSFLSIAHNISDKVDRIKPANDGTASNCPSVPPPRKQ